MVVRNIVWAAGFVMTTNWLVLGYFVQKLDQERAAKYKLQVQYEKLEILYDKQRRKYVSVTVGRNRLN